MAFVAFLFCLTVVYCQTVFNLYLDSNGRILQLFTGSTAVAPAAPVTLNTNNSNAITVSTYSIIWAKLDTLTPDVNVSSDSIFDVTPNVKMIVPWVDLSQAIYREPGQWECARIPKASGLPFSCTGSGVSVDFGLIEPFGSNFLKISITTNVSDATTLSKFFSLAAHRLDARQAVVSDAASVADHNNERLDANRSHVAALYVFVGFCLLSISIISAMWQTWLWIGCECCIKEGFCGYPWRPIILWSILFFGIQQVVCWSGGFLGWIAIAAMQSVYCILVLILYAMFYCKPCRVCCRSTGECCSCPESCVKNFDEEDNKDNFADDPHIDTRNIIHRDKEEQPLNYFPARCSKFQYRCLVGWFVSLNIGIIICLIIWYVWTVDSYLIWDRQTNEVIVEYQPALISRSLALVYAYPGMAQRLAFNVFHKEQTRECGKKYNKKLTTDSDRKAEIYDEFIHKYNIDMSMFNRTDYTQFNSVNDWFTRELHPDVNRNLRPIADPAISDVVVSPADARVMAFPNIEADISIWIKGSEFSVKDFLSVNDTVAARYTGGSMAIVRLAPQDYHRFHSPVSGKIVDEYFAEGTIFSVSADGMTSGNDAHLNQRVITWIDTGPDHYGTVGFVSIGATCVGSIYMFHRPGYIIQKGEPMGFFQFGGSTVVMVFEPNRVKFQDDIVFHSSQKVETYLRVGSRIGFKSP